MTQRYPQPVTPAMLLPSNENITKPRYGTPGDWVMGVAGNDVDTATRSVPIVNSGSAFANTPYPISTQTQKAAAMVPPLQIVSDIGIDYGAYTGQAGRGGVITPKTPYPDATSPPAVAVVSPNTGLAAGATAVTISGTGFTGATAVTFGGTPATAVVVVSPTSITATSPAHAAGTVDVRVTTPQGTSPIGGVSDNFIYT